MGIWESSRREFLRKAALTASVAALGNARSWGTGVEKPDDTFRIASLPIEVAPDRILSLTTYNEQFPGPIVRLKEGQPVAVEILNETDRPEQFHWHGRHIPADVDGAAEEGSPWIPPHGSRRMRFTPSPSGFRFYHSHVRAGADLSAGQYGGLVGPVYIEPKNEPGAYDREVFLVLKEFQPVLSRGGDMAMDFLSQSAEDSALKEEGESAMRASLAAGAPHGYEVGYESFTINGKMFGHGEPIRIKLGERVLLHVLNGSATEIRSLALPGHTFRVVALDGNPVPNPASVPVLWIGTAERVSAIVEMRHPGVSVLGDTSDDDRHHGMGIIVEYAGCRGRGAWISPPRARWNYMRFARSEAESREPDETLTMIIRKDNAAEEGFNRWTINGKAFPEDGMNTEPFHRFREGRRYRVVLKNASDDIHPVHHRHSFEVTSIAGHSMSGLMKDVLMVGGYQQAEIDFVADNPGKALFHCHQQLHMDFGFMTTFEYA
jgi:FtsP/CotA-like multicopper oxidase with cupredoxin domain